MQPAAQPGANANPLNDPQTADSPMAWAVFLFQKVLFYFAVIPAIAVGRKRFGERILTFNVVIISSMLVWLTFGVGAGCGAMGGVPDSQRLEGGRQTIGTVLMDSIMPKERKSAAQIAEEREAAKGGAGLLAVLGFLIAGGFTVLIGLRYLGVMRRFLSKDLSVHSRQDGEPLGIWYALPLPNELQPYVVRCLLEPAAFLVPSLIVASLTASSLVGTAAFFFTLCFVGYQMLNLSHERSRILDQADARIEAAVATTDFDATPAKDVRHVPPVARAAVRARQQFEALRSPAGAPQEGGSGLIPKAARSAGG